MEYVIRFGVVLTLLVFLPLYGIFYLVIGVFDFGIAALSIVALVLLHEASHLAAIQLAGEHVVRVTVDRWIGIETSAQGKKRILIALAPLPMHITWVAVCLLFLRLPMTTLAAIATTLDNLGDWKDVYDTIREKP
jgi:hypothetical protein